MTAATFSLSPVSPPQPMKKTFLPLTLLLTALLAFTGCPADAEVAPAFINFAGFNLETPGRGAATEAITEVWVFADEEIVGIFPIPARIPILRVGSTELRFAPGIRENGISSTPDIYPFYGEVRQTLDLVPGESIDVGVRTIGYKPDVQFSIVEGFEAGETRAFTVQIRGDTILEPSQDNVRSGDFSGKLYLDTETPLVEMASSQTFVDLLGNSNSVWLEVDYRSEAAVVFGVTGEVGGQPARNFDPGFVPRNEWTKIYFNLTEIIVRANFDNEVSLNFSALLPGDRTEAVVYMDNIKLLHF